MKKTKLILEDAVQQLNDAYKSELHLVQNYGGENKWHLKYTNKKGEDVWITNKGLSPGHLINHIDFALQLLGKPPTHINMSKQLVKKLKQE